MFTDFSRMPATGRFHHRRRGPPASDSRRPQRAARFRSCVTSTSVVPCSRFSRNMRSATSTPVAPSRLPRRLVGHQQLGFAGECARYRHALLFAAGQLPRIMRDPPGEADAIEPDPRAGFGIGCAGQFEREHHVLQRRQRRQQLERLEHEAQQPLAHRRQRVFVEDGQRRTVDVDISRRRPVEARQQSRAALSCRSRTHRQWRSTRPVRPRTSRRRGWSAGRRRS